MMTKKGGRKSRWTVPLSNRDGLNNSFWENIHFGRVVVWYGGEPDDHPFFQSIHSIKLPLFLCSSFSSNHSGKKIAR